MGRRLLQVALLAPLIVAVPVLLSFSRVFAVGLTNRSVTVGTSAPGIATTYDFKFDITSNAALGSIVFEVCANSPLPQLPCVPPTGFDFTAATLDAQTGEIGFAIDAGSLSANYLLLTRLPAPATPQTSTYSFANVTNPTTPDSTFFIRLFTYSTADGTGTPVEEAGLALSTSGQFGVTAYVPPFLQFCVGITITANDCSTAAGNFVDFGVLSSSSPATATSQMAAATNGVGGLSISVLGTTMTSGVNVIPALASPGVSNPGLSQFGLNLRANTVPVVGQEPYGPGTIAPTADYNTPNLFTFKSGDIIAQSLLSTDFTTLTASYLVNISSSQPPGVYTATMTYVATATF